MPDINSKVLVLSTVRHSLTLILIGGLGGAVAYFIGLPMAFMVGSLLAVGVTVSLRSPVPKAFEFPKIVRTSFVALIGAMIGGAFSPVFLSLIGSLWISLLVVAVFTLLAHAVGYGLYRKFGGYDSATAFFAASPGGLAESASMAEDVGADTSVVLTMHSLRIMLIVTGIPILFFLWNGAMVGSGAGVSLVQEKPDWVDVVVLLSCAAGGLVLGRLLRLPTPQLLGPIVLCAGLSMAGVVSVDTPNWLLNLAQLVVGTALGTLLVGMDRQSLIKALMLGGFVTLLTTVISFGFALLLMLWVEQTLDVLFISLAPGGITEMSLIAFSLGASPIYVAVHHLFRILLTVFTVSLLSRSRFFKTQ